MKVRLMNALASPVKMVPHVLTSSMALYVTVHRGIQERHAVMISTNVEAVHAKMVERVRT